MSKTKFIWLLLIAAVFICGGVFHMGWAQTNKDKLASRKEEISKEIAKTKKLIKEYQGQQRSVTNEISLINDEIALREQLIQEYQADAGKIGENMIHNEKEIEQLHEKVDLIKKEYSDMIYNGYKHRGSYSKLAFILSSKDFYQAIRRVDFLRQYTEQRKFQLNEIYSASAEIQNIQGLLESQRSEKIILGQSEAEEKTEIALSKAEQEVKLKSLVAEESKLREIQKKQERERQQLKAKIQEIINAEAEAERKRQEQIRKAELNRIAEEKRKSEEKRKQEIAADGSKTTTLPDPPKASVESETLKIERAPETIAANQSFEKNKGALPWPVSAGAIQSKFGRHAHESIKELEVNNNGVDFLTSANAEVKSVFSGKVTSVFNIPGAGYNIIVTHGTYKTVYSGLTNANVSVGSQVSSGQSLGTVMDSGEGYLLHFELWRINETGIGTPQNPELWIKRR